jgi:uncharacterized DUF497 family protein
MPSTFEWDEDKAQENLKKHRVSFEEAATILGDPLTVTILDPSHSGAEERYVDIGASSKGRILVVVYTERGNHIRIISCRKATPTERRKYEQGSY